MSHLLFLTRTNQNSILGCSPHVHVSGINPQKIENPDKALDRVSISKGVAYKQIMVQGGVMNCQVKILKGIFGDSHFCITSNPYQIPWEQYTIKIPDVHKKLCDSLLLGEWVFWSALYLPWPRIIRSAGKYEIWSQVVQGWLVGGLIVAENVESTVEETQPIITQTSSSNLLAILGHLIRNSLWRVCLLEVLQANSVASYDPLWSLRIAAKALPSNNGTVGNGLCLGSAFWATSGTVGTGLHLGSSVFWATNSTVGMWISI